MMERLTGWKPAAPKGWLQVCAGLIWCGVGLMLLGYSWRWTAAEGWLASAPFLVAGLLASLGTQHFFRWMASKNVERIHALPERPCLFAFQSWTSYPLVLFMIGLGVGLKASPLPRFLLAGAYLAIGTGLFLAGLSMLISLPTVGERGAG